MVPQIREPAVEKNEPQEGSLARSPSVRSMPCEVQEAMAIMQKQMSTLMSSIVNCLDVDGPRMSRLTRHYNEESYAATMFRTRSLSPRPRR